MRLIPAIDLKGGRCVRLMQGQFNQETRYPTDALTLLAKYRSLGADWLHVVDLDGARDGALGNRAIIEQLLGSPRLEHSTWWRTAQHRGGRRHVEGRREPRGHR